MADKIPVKARYSGSDVISLGELETGDTINASYISNLPSDLPATGADGNVLTSDGTNWASETPAGGGAWTLISTQSYISDGNYDGGPANLTVSGIDRTAYQMYAINITNCRPWNNGSKILFRVGNSSNIHTGSDYNAHSLTAMSTEAGSGPFHHIRKAQDHMELTGSTATYNGDRERTNGHYFFCPGYTGYGSNHPYAHIWGTSSTVYDSNKACYHHRMAGMVGTAIDITRIQIYWSNNSFQDGTLSVYGIANT